MRVNLQRAHDEATRCIQCGFCLPTCPTYRVFGEEKHSPRGRIQLVKLWAEGKTEPDASLQTALDLCLDCRACETACPIDVRYGTILSAARDELVERKTAAPVHEEASVWERLQTWRPVGRAADAAFRWLMRRIVAVPARVRIASRMAHFVLNSAPGRWLQRVISRRHGSWLAASLTFARALPAPDKPSAWPVSTPMAAGVTSETDIGAVGHPNRDGAKRRPRAALFLGCAQEGLFPETNRATAALLQEAGFDVDVPAQQYCCGALHRHHGDQQFARELVLRNMRTFGAFEEQAPYDVVVMNAGGCMAWIKEAAQLFEPHTEEHTAAAKMAERTRDISEVLMSAGFLDTTSSRDEAVEAAAEGSKPRVVYQPSCHLKHVCGVAADPLALLQRVCAGTVALPSDGGSCCGSAGIYNALQPQASSAILRRKMDAISDADPDVIVTSNPGCHLQMMAGVRERGWEHRVQVKQLADFLKEQIDGG